MVTNVSSGWHSLDNLLTVAGSQTGRERDYEQKRAQAQVDDASSGNDDDDDDDNGDGAGDAGSCDKRMNVPIVYSETSQRALLHKVHASMVSVLSLPLFDHPDPGDTKAP